MGFSLCTAFHNGTRKKRCALQQGEALSCRSSVPVGNARRIISLPKFKSEIILPAVVYDRCPLSKQSTGLFRNSPLAERLPGFLWGFAPRPTTLLKKGRSKTFPFLTGITNFEGKRTMQNRRPAYGGEVICT